MKAPKPLLLAGWLVLHQLAFGQLQWYQNQDGQNVSPFGTYASSIFPLGSHSFVACYQWQVNNDEYTWKVSKTGSNGTEQNSFLVSGIMAQAEIRVGRDQTVFVLKRNYPYGQNPEYSLYRLSSNLTLLSEKLISLPGDFGIINLNAFEIDNEGNVYLAGDGQYPDGAGVSMASFVMKTNKNFVTRWSRMDSVQTSYTRLHVDNQQRVTLIEDFYSMYPAIKVIRINKTGTHATVHTVVPDSMRYNLYSLIDKKNNLYLYGGKMVNDSVQAAFLCKLPATAGSFHFRKTIHTAPSSLLNDIRIDPGGRMFGLATLYFPDEIETRITRINPSNGQFIWNRKISFRTDSCQFTKLVVDQTDRFYAVGDKKSGSFFAKGYALRLKKNGQTDGRLTAPDSAAFQRVHSLVDGIIGADRELIAIGNTNDFDTTIYNSTYNRAFAVRFGNDQHCEQETSRNSQEETNTATAETTVTRLQLFPNPVQDQLRVSGLNPDEYDKLFVYNMQGAVLFQQKISTPSALLDLTNFSGGVYLLVLRSSVSLKEKTIKFLVSK